MRIAKQLLHSVVTVSVVVCLATAGVRALAATATGEGTRGAPDGLAQTEVGQEQLRSSTGRVSTQPAAVIQEFQRNGLAGEDLTLLFAIREVLGQLSDEDMTRVVKLLQQAL